MCSIIISFVIHDNMDAYDFGFAHKVELHSFFQQKMVYDYDEESTIRDMLLYICQSAPANPNQGYGDSGLRNRFLLVDGEKHRRFGRLETRLCKMLAYIQQPDELQFIIVLGYPGGGVGVGASQGIHYYIYSNESNHMGKAHVHAKYAEYMASIDIRTGAVLSGTLPKKQLKKALKAIHDNQAFLIKEWNEYSNGFEIAQEGYFYDKKQKKMCFVPYG